MIRTYGYLVESEAIPRRQILFLFGQKRWILSLISIRMVVVSTVKFFIDHFSQRRIVLNSRDIFIRRIVCLNEVRIRILPRRRLLFNLHIRIHLAEVFLPLHLDVAVYSGLVMVLLTRTYISGAVAMVQVVTGESCGGCGRVLFHLSCVRWRNRTRILGARF